MHNVHGISPCQIASGHNPNLPNVLVNKLSALEGTTISEVVGKHINAMHHARNALVKSETLDRIRRALRKKVRSVIDNISTGDKVYYKRHFYQTRWNLYSCSSM